MRSNRAKNETLGTHTEADGFPRNPVPVLNPSSAMTTKPKHHDHSVCEIIGLRFRDRSLEEVADSLVTDARTGVRREVFFVNAHCINIAARNEAYGSLLRNAPYLYADGVGMAVAARIWGRPLQNNVNGTDLFPILCRKAAEQGVPVAFLGGGPGIAKTCAARLLEVCPSLRIVAANHGYLPVEEEREFLQYACSNGARILLVAKGVPTQELWMQEHAPGLDVPVIMGVGALLDFYSGAVPRAPFFVRKLRMEWAFRFLMEPRRLFRRYIIGIPEFFVRVIKARFNSQL